MFATRTRGLADPKRARPRWTSGPQDRGAL